MCDAVVSIYSHGVFQLNISQRSTVNQNKSVKLLVQKYLCLLAKVLVAAMIGGFNCYHIMVFIYFSFAIFQNDL